MTAPNRYAQHLAPALDIWAGLDGYVIGHVGGPIREIVRDPMTDKPITFPTWEEAANAFRAAIRARETLSMIGADNEP